MTSRAEPSSTASVRVGIVEDQAPLRNALAALIDGTPGFRLTGTYGSAESAMAGVEASAPDVLLLDIGLPGQSGLAALPALKTRAPGCAVVMLTVHVDEDRIFDALAAGAVGYLVKDTPPARLLAAVQEAAHGGAPMTPEIARKVVTAFRKVAAPPAEPQRLSERETQVLQHLADGYSYQNIAARLEVSVETVRTYIRRVYEKLHVHTRSEAVARAMRSGIVR